MDFDPQLLRHVAELLTLSQSQDGEIQRKVYCEMEMMVENVPTLSLYFIAIAQDQNYAVTLRRLALFELRYLAKSVREDLVPCFLQSFNAMFQSVMDTMNQDLMKHAAIVMANVVIHYGPESVRNLTEIIKVMCQNPVFAESALDAMLQLADNSNVFSFPFEWLQELPRFIQGEYANTRACCDSLSILRNLLEREDSHEFFQEVLRLILSNFEVYNVSARVDAMCIVAEFFGQTGDGVLGTFLAFCLQTQDHDWLHEMLCVLEHFESIPFHPGFVSSLFPLLGDDESEDGVCCVLDTTQELLLELYEKYPEEVLGTIVPLFDSCDNPCQVLRAIWIFASSSVSCDLSRYLELAVNCLSNPACRGDAVLCMYYLIVNDEKLFPNAIDAIMTHAIADERGTVQDKVLFALDGLFDSNVPRNRNWLIHLVQLYQQLLESEADNNLSYFIRAGQVIELFCAKTDFSDELYGKLHTLLIDNVMHVTPDTTLKLFDGQLIAVLQSKLCPTFCQSCVDLLGRMAEIGPFLLNDERCFNGYCRILECFVSTYSRDAWNHPAFLAIVRLITEKVITEPELFDLTKFFSFVKCALSRFPIQDTEFGCVWLKLSVDLFNPCSSASTVKAIVDTFMELQLLDRVPPEAINGMLKNSFGIVKNGLVPRSVLSFILNLLQIKQQNGSFGPELNQLYATVGHLMSQ